MRTILPISGVFAAAMMVAVPLAGAQTGRETKQPFCLQQQGTGATNCNYVSMDACQKDMKVQGGTCIRNPAATTGSGAGDRMPSQMKK